MAQLSTSLPGTSQQPSLPAAQPVSTLDTEAKRRLEGMRQAAGTHEAARHRLAVRLGLGLNGSFFYPSDDRTILECQIIPYYQLAADFHSKHIFHFFAVSIQQLPRLRFKAHH